MAPYRGQLATTSVHSRCAVACGAAFALAMLSAGEAGAAGPVEAAAPPADAGPISWAVPAGVSAIGGRDPAVELGGGRPPHISGMPGQEAQYGAQVDLHSFAAIFGKRLVRSGLTINRGRVRLSVKIRF